MIIVCLEGCHGSGKTEICKQFENTGFNILDEAFFEMPKYSLHPQSLTMETMWVSHWMQRCLAKQAECQGPAGKDTIFIADRSPYSAVFYSKKHGELLDPLISAMVDELREHDIHIYTVVIEVATDVLWNRIQQRLAREPERIKYNENDRLWMDKTINFYHSRTWDFRVHNNENEISDCMTNLMKQLSENLAHLPEHFHFMRPATPMRTISAPIEGENATA